MPSLKMADVEVGEAIRNTVENLHFVTNAAVRTEARYGKTSF